MIAAELVTVVRERADIDWWRRENVRSAMRIAVKRILRKHGFPPDLQDEAIRRVIQQAEALAGSFAERHDLRRGRICGDDSSAGLAAYIYRFSAITRRATSRRRVPRCS